MRLAKLEEWGTELGLCLVHFEDALGKNWLDMKSSGVSPHTWMSGLRASLLLWVKEGDLQVILDQPDSPRLDECSARAALQLPLLGDVLGVVVKQLSGAAFVARVGQELANPYYYYPPTPQA